MLAEYEDETFGRVRSVGLPLHVSAASTPAYRAGPGAGCRSGRHPGRAGLLTRVDGRLRGPEPSAAVPAARRGSIAADVWVGRHMGPGLVLLAAIGGAALARALGGRQVRAGRPTVRAADTARDIPAGRAAGHRGDVGCGAVPAAGRSRSGGRPHPGWWLAACLARPVQVRRGHRGDPMTASTCSSSDWTPPIDPFQDGCWVLGSWSVSHSWYGCCSSVAGSRPYL